MTQVEQPAGQEAYIILEDVHKSFAPTLKHPHLTCVYQGLNFTVRRGEVVGIVGPNAVGKTVLCDLLSGIPAPDSGQISIRWRSPSRHVKVGYVRQNYRAALLPWRNVLDNICWGLKLARVPKGKRRKAGEQLIGEIGVKLDLKAFPYELSGGQQQMVAFLQAMLVGPELLLLDEPFQSLDLENRLLMEEVLLETLRNNDPITTILVSHDLNEVVLLSDRILVLSKRPPHVVDVLTIDLPNRRDVFKTPSEAGFTGIVAKVRMAFKEAAELC